jgi:hypothetical protein
VTILVINITANSTLRLIFVASNWRCPTVVDLKQSKQLSNLNRYDRHTIKKTWKKRYNKDSSDFFIFTVNTSFSWKIPIWWLTLTTEEWIWRKKQASNHSWKKSTPNIRNAAPYVKMIFRGDIRPIEKEHETHTRI